MTGWDEHAGTRFGFHLFRAQRAMQRAIDAALRPLGATARLVGVLEQVRRHPGLSAAGLARALQITPQSIAPVIGELQARGLVAGSEHPGRRASASFAVTAAGDAFLEQGSRLMDAAQARLLDGFSSRERAEIMRLLDRAHANALALERDGLG